MEQAFGDPGESVEVDDWLLVLASPVGDWHPGELTEVDDQLLAMASPVGDSILDFFRGGSFPAS